jgi:subtilase family serine protease
MSNGGTGAGQTTAIFELDGYDPSDIATYLSTYNLGSAKYSNVLVDGATNTPGSGATEVELDMEVMSALAPDAAQKIYIGPNTTTGVDDIYNKIVTDDQAKVTSISWGECEAASGDAQLDTLDNIFAQGAAQGQAFFAASGDSGAYACQTSSTTLAVGSPADDPHVVGVGGTSLTLNSDGTYASEAAWGANGSGSGGGISSHFTRPSYQTGNNLTNLNREVPDVSADADPSTGYSMYCTVADAEYCSQGWLEIGGTSAAAPLWAALSTDLNEYLTSQGKAGLGSASDSLYALYNTTQPDSAYHDITTGNNLYYAATPGYDTATGLGTPDAWNIARDLSSLPTTGGGGTSGTTQLLLNPGFDSGATSWVESSSGAYEIVDTTKPHAGGTSAHLCGYATCQDSIYQTVTLPAKTTKVVLSDWIYISTQETSKACVDDLNLSLRTSNGAIISIPQRLSNTNSSAWTQYTFNVTSALSRYSGKSIEVYFNASNKATATTDFFVDDVALNVTHS